MRAHTQMIYTFHQPTIYKELLRGVVGVCICMMPFVFVWPHWFFTLLFLGSAVGFLTYIWAILRDYKTEITIQNAHLHIQHFYHKSVSLQDLETFRLKYYDMRAFARLRNKDEEFRNGWFELVLADAHVKIALTSTLKGFDELLESIILHANLQNIDFDEPSKYYLMHFGIFIDKILADDKERQHKNT
jgi:hypothetical protein